MHYLKTGSMIQSNELIFLNSRMIRNIKKKDNGMVYRKKRYGREKFVCLKQEME